MNLLSQLEKIVGAHGVLSKSDDLMVYECDAFVAAKQRPEFVVFPTSTSQVSELVKFARANNLVVVSRGAGTGLAGARWPKADV